MQMDNASRLEDALNQTYQHLRQGNFGSLTDLIAATEDGMQDIAAISDPVVAARLRDLAVRNAACLQAAAKGVRATRRRMSEVLSASCGLRTYNGRGETAQILPQTGALKARL